MEETARQLEAALRAGRYQEVEQASRGLLAQNRFYLWHLYLIAALLRTGRRDEAARELDVLFSYKFNIHDRAWPEIKEAFPEKFEQHFILSTMKPEVSFESGPSVRRSWAVPFPLADVQAFARVTEDLVREAVPALPALEPASTTVATFGSCFAANLARHLKEAGVNAGNLLIEESINSPLANQAFLGAIVDPAGSPHAAAIRATFGEDFLDRALAQIASAGVVVVTLGVAPSFFHRDSNRFAFLERYRELLAAGRIAMRTPTVGEVKAVVADSLALLRAINRDARIYVSVSPVPLLGTAELANAVLADCVSKTTLRAALHEVLAETPLAGVHYWPSFEIVRWLGAHTTMPAFGADDGQSRHVSEWLVKMIVERFTEHLFGAAAAQPAAGFAAKIPARGAGLTRFS